MEQESPITATAFLEPEQVVSLFGLKPGDHVADFGAGHGYFTIPLARVVGNEGRVYAIDVQEHALDVIRAKAQLSHLLNIEYIWADLELAGGSRINDASCEGVVIANILFQAEKKEALFVEAYRILVSGGRLAVVEWREGSENKMGPVSAVRVSAKAAAEYAATAGFGDMREFDAGTHHYGLVFVKK